MAAERKIPRHVLGISGGKDSAALAIYLKEQGRVPEMEYFFCDTGAELEETYEFVDRLEAYLGKEIVRLSSGKPFDHHLAKFGNFLPSPKQRWCTRVMKIEPFEKFVGEDEAISYIAIRADEERDGYISLKQNIKTSFPFIHDGITRNDVFEILRRTVGIPEYYEWRSRSGCYFCFFQRRDEWMGLREKHPALYEKAKQYEQADPQTGNQYTWIQGTSLQALQDSPFGKLSAERKRKSGGSRTWQEILIEDGVDEDPENQACAICSL